MATGIWTSDKYEMIEELMARISDCFGHNHEWDVRVLDVIAGITKATTKEELDAISKFIATDIIGG